MAQQTRHGLYGGARPVYGSFAGKTEAVVTVAKAILAPAGRYRPHTVAGRYRPHAPGGRLS